MPIKQVFKSMNLNTQYLMGAGPLNGKSCPFIGGEYLTDVQEEIDALNNEIKLGHPNFFRDPKRMEVNTDDLDPIETIKKNAIAEFLRNQAAATDRTRDMGESNGKGGAGTGVATSAGNTEGAQASDSGSPANVEAAASGTTPGARLANLKAK